MSVTFSSGVNTKAIRRFVARLRESGATPRAFHVSVKGKTASAVFPVFMN